MTSETNPPSEIPATYSLVDESILKTFYLNEVEETLIMVWKGGLDHDDMQYKDDSFHSIELIKEHQVKFLISDTRRSEFAISPDLQIWYAEEIVPQLEEYGVLSCAIIVSDNLNILSSLEEISANILKKYGVQQIPHRFFPNLPEAFKWLSR